MTDPTRHFGDALLEHIRVHLEGFPRVACTEPGLRPAAVALVITADAAGRASFLITRRTSKLKRHAHQWALPGGRLDAGETVEEAALRETREEIGLALPEHSVLGLLDDFPTRSGFRMTPVVVWGDPSQPLRPDPHEVERVHTVPLAELDKPEVPVLSEIPESDRPLLSIPIPMLGTSIHSPTAAILFQMREVLIHGRHTRVSHYEQPLFAWK